MSQKNKKAIELGDEVRCKVTGLQGIVTSIATCLYGCDRLTVQPPMIKKSDKIPDSMWIDLPAVKLIKKGAVKAPTIDELPEKKTGGPMARSNVHVR